MSNYPPDRTWGALIVLFNAIAACCFLTITFFAAAAFHFIGKGYSDAGAPNAFGLLGVVVFIGGMFVVLCYVLGIIGGIGIMSGQKWGFNLVLVFGIMGAILKLAHLPLGLILMVLDLACIYYCYQRLSGNLGPRPI